MCHSGKRHLVVSDKYVMDMRQQYCTNIIAHQTVELETKRSFPLEPLKKN